MHSGVLQGKRKRNAWQRSVGQRLSARGAPYPHLACCQGSADIDCTTRLKQEAERERLEQIASRKRAILAAEEQKVPRFTLVRALPGSLQPSWLETRGGEPAPACRGSSAEASLRGNEGQAAGGRCKARSGAKSARNSLALAELMMAVARRRRKCPASVRWKRNSLQRLLKPSAPRRYHGPDHGGTSSYIVNGRPSRRTCKQLRMRSELQCCSKAPPSGEVIILV